jgi:hypothetical protein
MVTTFSWRRWKRRKLIDIARLYLGTITSRVIMGQTNTMDEQCLFND